jgi:hypothetical protein
MISALMNFLSTNKLFFILFLALIVRGFTDTLFFFESWDFLPLFFIIYYIKKWKKFDIKYNSYLKIKN